MGTMSRVFFFKQTLPLAKKFGSTLPATNSSHLKIGHRKRKRSYSKHPFSGLLLLVSGRVRVGEGWLIFFRLPRFSRVFLVFVGDVFLFLTESKPW